MQQVGVTYARGEMPDDLAVCADGNRLQQILLNLLTNAAKFTRRGGSIAVDAARSGDNIHIHVRDTGRGIPADELTRIFEPFVQVEKEADQANQGGVGLGLAISRDLARAMGGDLGATSEPGQGSVFTVTLPAA